MTSNVGSQFISAAAPAGDAGHDEMRSRVMDSLRAVFRPEFLNRVDEVIVFHSLTDADLAAIVDRLLVDLERRLAEHDLRIELTPAVRQLVATEGNDPAFGARPLKRAIQRLVENPLARALLEGRFVPGSAIRVDADNVSGALVFSADGETVVTSADERRSDARRNGRREPASAIEMPIGRPSDSDRPVH
jgi:ATP-dependent Clp protease ATP-binding subunit ClpA